MRDAMENSKSQNILRGCCRVGLGWRVFRSLIKKITFELRYERVERVSCVAVWEGTFQANGIVGKRLLLEVTMEPVQMNRGEIIKPGDEGTHCSGLCKPLASSY